MDYYIYFVLNKGIHDFVCVIIESGNKNGQKNENKV